MTEVFDLVCLVLLFVTAATAFAPLLVRRRWWVRGVLVCPVVFGVSATVAFDCMARTGAQGPEMFGLAWLLTLQAAVLAACIAIRLLFETIRGAMAAHARRRARER
jgi:ABC-type molybdate transport system permease subunit